MDLTQALVRRANVPHAQSATFVRHFFETIQEALLREKIVKVRGFGTFKLISVEARESVNVVDGSRIQIASHTKVTFTPDAVLRDAVNKPFAEFETVVLSDNIDLAALEALDVEDVAIVEEEVPTTPIVTEEEPSTSDVIEEVPEASTVAKSPFVREEESVVPDSREEEASTSPKVKEEEAAASSETEDESSGTEKEPSETEEKSSGTEEEQTGTEEEPIETEEVATEPATLDAVAAVPSVPQPARRRCGFLCCIIAFLCAVLLFVGGYVVGYLRPVVLPFLDGGSETTAQQGPSPNEASAGKASANKPSVNKPATNKPIVADDSITSSAHADSSVSGPSIPASSATTSKVPSETLAYPQLEGGEYWIVGIKGTEVMKPGRTLLNFSLKYYKSTDFVDYICVMNDIKNPDVVPLDKELRIPELKKK